MRQPYLSISHKRTREYELLVVGWAGFGWLALIALAFFLIGLVL